MLRLTDGETYRVVLHAEDDGPLTLGDFCRLLERFEGMQASGALRGRGYELRLTITATGTAQALNSAITALGRARRACGLPPTDVVAAGVNAAGEAGWPWNPSGDLQLVGVEEVAELLDSSRRQVEDLSADPRFPRSLGELDGRPVWDRHQVLDHLAQQLRPTT